MKWNEMKWIYKTKIVTYYLIVINLGMSNPHFKQHGYKNSSNVNYDDICEECLECVCEHKYPILDLNDETCPICLDELIESQTVILNQCYHKYDDSCIGCLPNKPAADIGIGINICCPVCRQTNTSYTRYIDYKIQLQNSILPPIGSISFEIYYKIFKQYKHCISPTQQMLTYIKESEELFKEVLLKQQNKTKQKNALLNMRVNMVPNLK